MGDLDRPLLFTSLRDLTLPARLVVAAFLMAVGVGYVSALIQVHFQDAPAGELMPSVEDTTDKYHGKPGSSQLRRLLMAPEHLPFTGAGTMTPAFTTRAGLPGAVARLVEEKNLPEAEAEKVVRKERDGERLALVAWLDAGAPKAPYEADKFELTGELTTQPLTKKYLDTEDDKRYARIQKILTDRCARCHKTSYDGATSAFPLENHRDLLVYAGPEASGGVSLKKLAQTSHVHLLGFGMLYGLTGMIFSLTSYPKFVRCVLAPLPLVLQVMEIGLGWWGGLASPHLAGLVPVLGGLVALGLMLHIVLTLLNLFGKVGALVILLLLVGAGAGGFVLKTKYVDNYLKMEKERAGRVS